MSILIKNGNIITATDNYIADIYIEDEKVKIIGKDLSIKADKEINSSNKFVFPGGVDPHVHLDMPFMGTFSSDTHETGTRAALFGGTTTVIDFVLQKQGNSLKSALDEWNSRANGTAVGDRAGIDLQLSGNNLNQVTNIVCDCNASQVADADGSDGARIGQ